MLKNLVITTAMSALLIGAAAAEGTGTAPSPATPPAASAPAAKPSDKSSEMSKPAASSSAKFINSQQADQYLASNFKGTDVLGPDNQKIGDVSDVLFAKDGKVLAYVVGVGGFLGIGAKDVALEPSAFEVVAGDKSKNEADKLKIAMTKDELKQAATFEPYRAPSSTTGMGSTSPRPAPLGSRPTPSSPPAAR